MQVAAAISLMSGALFCTVLERGTGFVDTATFVDGSVLRDLISDDGCTAITILDPVQCLSCDGLLGQWVRLAQAGHFDLVVLLNQPPTVNQEQRFTLRRMTPAGVLAVPRSATKVPSSYVLRDGVAMDSAIGLAAQMPLLSWLESEGPMDC